MYRLILYVRRFDLELKKAFERDSAFSVFTDNELNDSKQTTKYSIVEWSLVLFVNISNLNLKVILRVFFEYFTQIAV